MKVALLTYFKTLSYGATLQTYATVKVLESLGHEVELINLEIPNPYGRIKGLLLFPKWIKTWLFRKKYFKHVTRKYVDSAELRQNPPQADIYMVGSDQTWNLDISGDKASSFFLDFVKDNSKKVTYAASFGKERLENTNWITVEEVTSLLHQFKHIAIREKSGKDMLASMGIDSVQVVDPALLFKDYNELVGDVCDRNELVLFKVDNSAAFYDKAAIVGRNISLPICSLGSLRRIKGMRCPYPDGLEGWMRRLVSARYILTDSFHGLVISLLYHKQFVLILGDPRKTTRLRSLAHLVGLDDRIMDVETPVSDIITKLQQQIDYGKVDEILEKEREFSLSYLKSILVK